MRITNVQFCALSMTAAHVVRVHEGTRVFAPVIVETAEAARITVVEAVEASATRAGVITGSAGHAASAKAAWQLCLKPLGSLARLASGATPEGGVGLEALRPAAVVGSTVAGGSERPVSGTASVAPMARLRGQDQRGLQDGFGAGFVSGVATSDKTSTNGTSPIYLWDFRTSSPPG